MFKLAPSLVGYTSSPSLSRIWKYAEVSNKILYVSTTFISQRRSICCSNPSPSPSFIESQSKLDVLVSEFVAAITSCSSVPFCRIIHACIIKYVNYRVGFIGDQLVSTYLRLGYEEDAQRLFDEMPNKDIISWNSLISGLSRNELSAKCLIVFCRLRFEPGVQPNEVTLISMTSACANVGALDEGRYIHGIALKLGMLCEMKLGNALINLYGKCGSINSACQLFDAMPVPNLVSWNSIIVILSRYGSAKEGVGFFNSMRQVGIKPDQATLVTILEACEELGVGYLADTIHGLILRSGLVANVTIETAILSLYAKLGRLFASCKVFREMVDPDRIAWTAMLAGYAMHGHGSKAVELFKLMVKKGVCPDHVTFTHLLSACAHSGLVNEGKYYFKMMSEAFKVEPRLDHYSCMVDLLGRSGFLSDARDLIRHMPMEPNSAVWGALLGACRIYGDIELGKEVAERLFALDPSDSRNYIMLANIYSAAGLWKEASKIRGLMTERGLIRNSGCSFIEHGKEIHRFVVGDQSHPQSEKIYSKLEELIGKIRAAGFVSRTEYVLHDVREEVKEDMINKHSEKLAIAFGLLVVDPSMPLIITKNLRICGDCHGMAKMVSLIEKRTIIIRDSKRFHHFVSGLCSCGDYW